jgi:transcriptional regulator with XRE-family HTH domain
MTFYEALDIAMREKGLRAVDIAERTGMHQSYISKLKSGHQKSVDWEKALVIIAALGMTPNEFYELQKSDEADM